MTQIVRSLLILLACVVHAGILSSLSDKVTVMSHSDLPRYQKLPLFNPHRKDFTCVYQEQHVPPIDPQAEQWFQQALALDNPDIWFQKRDYAKIYQLYQQAAERNHWKAMLNLASLILSSYAVPEHDPEVAIRWVEKAMQLGVPDAYDQMGIYHQNGMIKGGNATSAYAFFQRAADMGSPSAMTFLGDKLNGTYDDPDGEFWGNLPVAVSMLECAFAQGHGPAAYELGFIYKRPNTPETKDKALRILHDGVKLGCKDCADMLDVEFRGRNLLNGTSLVSHMDTARAERYSAIGHMLEFYGERLKLPNLDKVLPLPPASLPKWNGDEHALINAAKAVVPHPKAEGKHAEAELPKDYVVFDPVLPADISTCMTEAGRIRAVAEVAPQQVAGNESCTQTGIWEGRIAADHPLAMLFNRWDRQSYVEKGQAFPSPAAQHLDIAAAEVRWTYLGSANAVLYGDILGITL